jgi:hypothetical protein
VSWDVGRPQRRAEKKERKSNESMRRLLRAMGIDPSPFQTRNDLKHALLIVKKSERTKRKVRGDLDVCTARMARAAHRPPDWRRDPAGFAPSLTPERWSF